MALVRVFTPQSASEQTVVVAMFEAHEIPTHVHNGHLASLLPGVVIDAYNSSSVMVPEERLEPASELIAHFGRASGVPQHTSRGSTLVLRNLFEFLLRGRFMPQRVTEPSARHRFDGRSIAREVRSIARRTGLLGKIARAA